METHFLKNNYLEPAGHLISYGNVANSSIRAASPDMQYFIYIKRLQSLAKAGREERSGYLSQNLTGISTSAGSCVCLFWFVLSFHFLRHAE